MNSQMLNYLKKDEIGRVIAKGLAEVYTAQSPTPIKYLAQWLKTYSSNQKQMQKISQQQSIKKANLDLYNKNQSLIQMQNQQKQKEHQQHLHKIQTFKNMIKNHQYHMELLIEVFPDFIQKLLGFTGVYIGELNHPKRQITDQDTDPNAHLDLSVPKLINYIGSSVTHSNLMRGQVLSLDKGVTGEVFSLSLDDEPPKLNEEGVQVPSQGQKKYVYVSNVVRNQKMQFFRLPKLGSYLAIPLIYHSYLSESIFDEAYAARQKYFEEVDEFNAAREQDLKQFHQQIADQEKKIHDLSAKNPDQSQLQPFREQIRQIRAKILEKEAEKIEMPQPTLTLQKRQFVVCADNLGTDEEISIQNIQFMVDMVKHFRNSWQEKEHQLLQKDVELQFEYIKKLGEPLQTIKDNIEHALQIDEQSAKQIAELSDEGIKAYKSESWQLNSLRKLIKSQSKFIEAFLRLKHYRIVKFSNVIQSFLYFLGYKKSQVNIPEKTVINWKHVKTAYITEDTLHKILDYVVQGAKTGYYEQYCKISTLNEAFANFNQDELFGYNIGLGIFAKFIKMAIKHRISNVELRKAQKQVQRKLRQEIVQENEKINEEKAKTLEKHRSTISPEEVQLFNEEQWLTAYETQHPLKEVPAEIIDDIDNDI